MSENNRPLKTEDEQFPEQLAIIKKSTDEAMENTRKSLSGVDFSQMDKMRETYIRNITPTIKAMASTFEQYHEISNQISHTLAQPMLELKKRIAEITAPFGDFQKRISEIIAPLVKVSIQLKAINKLGENQLIWFDTLDEDIANELLKSNNIEEVLYKHLEETKFFQINEIIKISRKSLFLEEKKTIYSESISAYRNKHYNLACIGFITIIDFLLSKISGESGTKFSKKVEAVVSKMKTNEVLDDFDMKYFYVFLSIEKTLGLLFDFSDFTKDEPLTLNRHWIAHGHTTKKYSKLDCIKFINLIYALLLIGSFKGGEEND